MSSIRSKVVSSVAWSTIGTIGERISVFLIMLVLVRLLDVKEFGTATTAVMVITILWPVARFGSFNYVVQHDAPDDAVLTGGFLATMAFAIPSSLLLFLAAGPLSTAFSDPALRPAVELLSPIFIIKSLGTIQEAILTKRFGFRALAVRRLAGVIAGGAAAIICALTGYGLYALIVQQLVMALISSVMTAISAPWKLDIAGGRAHMREVFAMGAQYTVAQMLSSINLSGYGLIIGLFLGTAEAGLFRLAFSAVDLCTQVTIVSFVNVSVPVFARLRGKPEQLREAYIRFVQATSLCTFVLFAWMSLMGPEIGRLLYGAKFDAAAPLIPVFCFAVFAATSNYIISALLGATGKPGAQTWVATAQSVSAVIMALITAPFGLFYAGIGHVLRVWLTTPMSYYYLWRESGVRPIQTLEAMGWPILAAAIGVAPLALLKFYAPFEHLPVIARLVVSSSLTGMTYGLFLIIVRPDLVLEMLQLGSPKLVAWIEQFPIARKCLRVDTRDVK